MSGRASSRVRVQNVAVGQAALRARLDALQARRTAAPDPEYDALEAGVRAMLDRASDAAYGVYPRPRRITNWWRGTLFEAAYQNLHAAETQIVRLYDPVELQAEVPEALARVYEGLPRDDPRRLLAQRIASATEAPSPAVVSKLIQSGHAAADQQHTRVRSFRNVVLIAAALITVFLVAFTAYVATHPSSVPLCFQSAGSAGGPATLVCPTSESAGGAGGPSESDILVVALLGLLGGALASAVSLRNVRGTSTPYDVPVSLALLKVPTGALTAIAALVAIRGDFVPGLSALDSQAQILAYALVFGYAQQLLTGLVDRQGQNILSRVPSPDSARDASGALVPGGVAGSATGAVVAPDGSGRADQADDSDLPDPQRRDGEDPTIVDDTGTVPDLDGDEDGDEDRAAGSTADSRGDSTGDSDDEEPNAAVGVIAAGALP